MDYLNALPIEVWHEILLQAAPFSSKLLNASEPILPSISTATPHKELYDTQSCRFILLTICKSLHPLVHRSLFIFPSHDSPENASNRLFLLSIYPNLTYFCMNTCKQNGDGDLKILRKVRGIGDSIRTFTLLARGELLMEMMRALPNAMPKFEQLNLFPETESSYMPNRSILLPSVYSVHMSHPYGIIDKKVLVLPSLRQLSLTLSEITSQLCIGLCQYASTLLELELDFNFSWRKRMVLPPDLFSVCYRLQTFTFNLSNIETSHSLRSNSLYDDSHQGLRTLVLCMESPKSHSYLILNATYFAQGRFPNLSLVVCRFERAPDTAELKLLTEKMSVLFTGLELRVEVQN